MFKKVVSRPIKRIFRGVPLRSVKINQFKFFSSYFGWVSRRLLFWFWERLNDRTVAFLPGGWKILNYLELVFACALFCSVVDRKEPQIQKKSRPQTAEEEVETCWFWIRWGPFLIGSSPCWKYVSRYTRFNLGLCINHVIGTFSHGRTTFSWHSDQPTRW